jgi:4-amino-4-deoxy-L-arabinose transferase-like glycosyltransferase
MPTELTRNTSTATKEKSFNVQLRANWMSKNVALLAILFATTVLTARWIWVVRENGDFGQTYEVASRISHGEVYGRDFFYCVAPLVCYLEAILVRIFNGSLWAHQISLFAWWYASLIAGYLAVRRLTNDQSILAAGGVLAVVLSAPFSTGGQSFNYAATTFLALSAYFYLTHQRNRAARFPLIAAGAFAGLGIFSKQNVGAAFFLFLVFFLVLDVILLSRTRIRALLLEMSLLFSGLLLGFGLPLFLVGHRLGIDVTLRHLFMEGVSEKGGFSLIALRMFPRYSTSDLIGTPHHRLIEGILSVVLLAMLLVIGVRRLKTVGEASNPEHLRPETVGRKPLALALLAITAIAALSLVELPMVNAIGQRLAACFLVRAIGFGLSLGQVFYFVSVAAFGLTAIVLLRKSWKKDREEAAAGEYAPELFIVCAAVAVSAAAQTSGIMYFPFAAPLAIIVLALVLEKRFRVRPEWINSTATVVTILIFVSPSYSKTFCHYEKLPQDSPFAGLYAAKPRAEFFREMWTSVHPLVNGKRTIWLLSNGPSSAYGGVSMPNVIPIDYTHTLMTQEVLVGMWNKSLPQRVVIDRTFFRNPAGLPPHSYYFTDQWLSKWLEANYTKILEERFPEQEIEVWILRNAPETDSNEKLKGS